MNLPANIERDHLLKAFDKIDQEGIPTKDDSTFYDVIHDGKRYPPKLVVSYANIFANGSELSRKDFEGGLGTPCFLLLEKNGFLIEDKRSFYIIGSKYGDANNEDIFPKMLERSVVSIGFAWDIDLSDYYLKDDDSIKQFLKNRGEPDKSVNAVRLFLKIKKGDYVAIKASGSPKGDKGYLSIVGTAKVVEKNGRVYEHDPGGLGHILHVEFIDAPVFKEFELGGYGSTVHKLKNKDHIHMLFGTDSFFDFLQRFIRQSSIVDLKTSDYPKTYAGLEVKVSFGQGNPARIPWIAFLGGGNTVPDGYYPVYLFYKDINLLILSYGMSETNIPKNGWELENVLTITDYFSKNNLGVPGRYGSSFIYKVYDISKELDKAEVDSDLNQLLSVYKEKIGNSNISPIPKKAVGFLYKTFYENTSASNLIISERSVLRFVSSLLTKPFVILTGLSGSGKTKLAQAFAMWLCESESQYAIVPVGADWTNREPLLGFPNALNPEEYVKADNKVLDLLIQADRVPDKPYFLILDEMNLSHVERYFADFLSVMESEGHIALHSGDTNRGGIPAKLKLPKNLFLIGTVNIDETTYMFSPKVLDRASVIEFRVNKDEMTNYLNSYTVLDMKSLSGAGAGMASNFVEIAKDSRIKAANAQEVNESLLSFFTELKNAGAEFGYRTASEILRFAAIAKKLEPNLTTAEIIDACVMQKLLPKVHGSKRKLDSVLKTLGNLCLTGTNNFENILRQKGNINISDSAIVKYPISLEKILRMYDNMVANGFTSYAEA
jgi:5-methylcytosine-specific restriction enzyme B